MNLCELQKNNNIANANMLLKLYGTIGGGDRNIWIWDQTEHVGWLGCAEQHYRQSAVYFALA